MGFDSCKTRRSSGSEVSSISSTSSFSSSVSSSVGRRCKTRGLFSSSCLGSSSRTYDTDDDDDQVHDGYRTDYDPGRGGYGKLVQRELEVQRTLVDYGAGSLGGFQSVAPSHYGQHDRSHGHGGSYRQGRDYHRKRHREDERHPADMPKRNEQEPRRNSYHESRPHMQEKNLRFRESGNSDDDDDDDQKRRT